jgi:FkbM family methyltransferase
MPRRPLPTVPGVVGLLTRAINRRQRSRFAARLARDEKLVTGVLAERLVGDSLCVDVGAHVGDFLDKFVAAAPSGEHVAIEPLPELAERLRDDYPHVRVEWCVLGDHEGSETFYRQIDRPAWSSLSPDHRATANSPVEELVVPMRRLDDVVERADFVKIDVEGAELGVLRGAGELLRAGPPILFEHAHIHARHFGTAPGDVWDELSRYDYKLYSLDGRGPHARQAFGAICQRAADSDYGTEAETNFLAER